MSLALIVPRALRPPRSERSTHRCHVTTCLSPCARTNDLRVRKDRPSRHVEENPRLCGCGARLASVVEELFWTSTARIVRITTPHVRSRGQPLETHSCRRPSIVAGVRHSSTTTDRPMTY